jgi:hypothetical protein
MHEHFCGQAFARTSFAESGEYECLLREVQRDWPNAITRDEMIELLGMAAPFIPHTPAIGIAFADGFT